MMASMQPRWAAGASIFCNASAANPRRRHWGAIHRKSPMKFVRIGSVCVSERFWGNGIGRKLLNLAQAWGIQQGAKDIRLAVRTFNAPAVRLYEEMGFETRAFEMGMPF